MSGLEPRTTDTRHARDATIAIGCVVFLTAPSPTPLLLFGSCLKTMTLRSLRAYSSQLRVKFMGIIFAPNFDRTTRWVCMGDMQTYRAATLHKTPGQRARDHA